MNNGKPIIVNGKMKRYKCVEEYVLLDEYGKVIPNSQELRNENGQSNKEFFIEPTKKRSNILPPTSFESQEKENNYKAVVKEELSTTTAMTLEVPRTKMPENPLHPNGLNVKKLIHTPSFETTPTPYLHRGMRPFKPVDELVPMPNSAELSEVRRSYRHKSRFPRLRYRYFLPRDYEDYQYYENDREYGPKVNYWRPHPEFRRPHPYRETFQPEYESSQEFLDSREPSFRPSSSNYFRNLLSKQKAESKKTLPKSNEIEYRIPLRTTKYATNERPNIPVRWLAPSAKSRELYKRPPLPPLPTETKSFILENSGSPSKIPQQPKKLEPLPISNPSLPNLNPLPPSSNLPAFIPTTPKPLQMSPENCKKLKDLAHSFGVSDPQKWVRNNCTSRTLECKNHGIAESRCSLQAQGHQAELNPGCFDEIDQFNKTRVYCRLNCEESDEATVSAKVPSWNHECSSHFTYQLERRRLDWYLWRSGSCINTSISFQIRCGFPRDPRVFYVQNKHLFEYEDRE
uniref:Uncharacterized protein n=1 Tax=Panagrolaimus sp. JU765 TaxID=591449 RepID=A0AC34Q9N2_9BILA